MFPKATEYALRATIYIAQRGRINHKLSIKEISENIDSPVSFTAKILQLLTAKASIIQSGRGPNGGYYMSEEALSLPIYEIIKAIGDDGIITNCVLGLPKCSDEHPCPMHSKYKIIKKELLRMFTETTIQSLAEDMNSQNIFLSAIKSNEEI